ncbi:hypothetical protein ACWDYJ_17590 [Streptomyces sp. NPDC003042]
MRDPHPMQSARAAAPECRTEPSPQPVFALPVCPLPACPVCAGPPERISWRQRPSEAVVLVFDPCGHRFTSPAPPLLAVTPADPSGPDPLRR